MYWRKTRSRKSQISTALEAKLKFQNVLIFEAKLNVPDYSDIWRSIGGRQSGECYQRIEYQGCLTERVFPRASALTSHITCSIGKLHEILCDYATQGSFTN